MSEQQSTLPLHYVLDDSVLDQIDEDVILEKWENTLIEYVDILTAANIRDGMEQIQARKSAYSNVSALVQLRGGKLEYLPQGKALKTAIMHKKMWDDHYYNRMDIKELSKKYNVNDMEPYVILRKQKKLHIDKIQPDLFPKKDS